MLINSAQPASTHLYFLKLTKIQYPESVFARPVFYSLSEIGIQCHFLYAIRERNLSSAYYFLVSKVKIPRLQGLEFGGFHTNRMLVRARFSDRCCVVDCYQSLCSWTILTAHFPLLCSFGAIARTSAAISLRTGWLFWLF